MEHNIIFRKDKTGEITAVFFDELADYNGNITCYARIGQHSSCCPLWVFHETRPARVEEYRDLLLELQSIYSPDQLVVHNRLPNFEKVISRMNQQLGEIFDRRKCK